MEIETQEITPGAAALYQSHTSLAEDCRRAITSIHQAFARDLTLQLSAQLRCAVTVKYSEMRECTFAQFMESRQPFSCAGSIKGLNSRLILDLEPSALFSLVELMLGGKPAPGSLPLRAPTEIEKQLLALVMTSIAGELERAWCTMVRVSLQFANIEAETQLPRLLAASDAVIAARFDVMLGDHTGCFTVLTPVHPAETLIETTERADGAAEIPEADRVSQILLDSSVGFDVWLDGVTLELRDVVQLREGCVIKFDYPTDRNLRSTINGAAGFSGQVVSTGRKRAFLIQSETRT